MRESLLALCREISQSMAVMEAPARAPRRRHRRRGGEELGHERSSRPEKLRERPARAGRGGDAAAPRRPARVAAPRRSPPGAPRPVRAARAAAHPAHHGGDVPLRGRRRLVVVRPARVQTWTEFDWQVLPIVAAARQAAALRAARPRAPGRAHRGVVGGAAQGRPLRPAERRAGRTLPVRARARPAGLERRLRARSSTASCGAGRIRPACGACSAPAAAGPPSWTACGRCSTSASPRRAPRRRSTWSRPRRSTRRCTGSPARRRSRRRTPTCCTSPPRAGRPSPRSSTRRCTGRRWCSPSTACSCASPISPPCAAAGRPAAASPRRGSPAGSRGPAYAGADVVSPVTDANAFWEKGLGIDPDKIHVLYNGLRQPEPPTPAPGNKVVVSVGRIDPLKDVHTMLRVAQETLRHVPDAQFLHYGPVTEGEEAYGRSCHALHEQLGLGDRFRFMGRTKDPNGVVRDADVVLMTSISEGLPMSILEAMGQGRPVVSTGVGGVPDVVRGCGVVTPPGDVHGLAMAVATLLREPELAAPARPARPRPARARRSTRRRASTATATCSRAAAEHGRVADEHRRAGSSPNARARSSRRASAARRRTCSRPPSCSRRGRACPPCARSRRGARSWRPHTPPPEKSTGPLPAPPEREGFASEAVSFVLAVLAIACWAAPLAAALGAAVVRTRAARRAAADARAPVGAAQPLPRPAGGPGPAAPPRARARALPGGAGRRAGARHGAERDRGQRAGWAFPMVAILGGASARKHQSPALISISR